MSDNEENSEQRRSPVWTVIAGLVLVVVVVMGAFLVFGGGSDDDSSANDNASGQDRPSSGSSSSTNSDPAASVCGLPGHDTNETLNAPPEGASWDLVGRVAVPKSKAAGPGKIDDETGVRYCFAHTREGAVMAATNAYSWDYSLRRDDVGVYEHGVAAGSGYDAAMRTARNGDAAGDEPQVFLQIRGFQLKSYTDTSALVSVALQAETGAMIEQPVELSWEKGDWRMRLLPDGSTSRAEPIDSLAGYVEWAGA